MKRVWPIGGIAAIVLIATACSAADPRVSFDVGSCDYDGARDLRAGSTEFAFTNKSAGFAGLAFLALPADGAVRDEALALVGRDSPVTGPPPTGIVLAGVVLAEPGEEVVERAPLTAGTYVVDCVTFAGDQPTHFWRAAAIEVR